MDSSCEMQRQAGMGQFRRTVDNHLILVFYSHLVLFKGDFVHFEFNYNLDFFVVKIDS